MNNIVFAVDDEVEILKLYENVLKTKDKEDDGIGLGFFDSLDEEEEEKCCELYTFESGEAYLEALNKFYKDGKRVSLSIVDMRMPGMHGLDVARAARKLDNDMVVTVVTAFSDYSPDELLGEFEHGIYYLQKPFRHNEFRLFVISNLKQWNETVNSNDLKNDLAVDSINDGLWDWKIDTNEVYFSSLWKQMIGFEDDELKNEYN